MLNFLVNAMTAQAEAYSLVFGPAMHKAQSANTEQEFLRRQAKDARKRG